MRDHLFHDPPWLPLLNAIHLEWRDAEILQGHDPDPEIERWLCEVGKWPIGPKVAH
jgi:hypothetical protein